MRTALYGMLLLATSANPKLPNSHADTETTKGSRPSLPLDDALLQHRPADEDIYYTGSLQYPSSFFESNETT